eukprot:3809319-Rhodomonas_salina.5
MLSTAGWCQYRTPRSKCVAQYSGRGRLLPPSPPLTASRAHHVVVREGRRVIERELTDTLTLVVAEAMSVL